VTTRFLPVDDTREPRRGGTRPARAASARPGDGRSWTGRARTARATDSGLPLVVAAATRRTRVSEMRIAAAADGGRSPALPRPAAVAPAVPQRRDLERTPRGQHRRVG
jgi:hypothetical protein